MSYVLQLIFTDNRFTILNSKWLPLFQFHHVAVCYLFLKMNIAVISEIVINKGSEQGIV